MTSQIINNPADCVDEFVSSLAEANRGLMKLPGHNVILRSDLDRIKGKVAVLSGGGSGHEPGHAGYVGHGMLTGAICGAIFASPPPHSILAAIRAVVKRGANGVILVVANYTGDRLNFGLAKSWAQSEGIKIEMVIIGEDWSQHKQDVIHKRGLAGVILMDKIVGAMSESGESIENIVHELQKLSMNTRTMGVCFRPCVLPGNTEANFNVEFGTMEVGMGIHGEAGAYSIPMESSSKIAEILFNEIQGEADDTLLNVSDRSIVLINNLGGTSNLEMGVFANDLLKQMHIKPERLYVGSYLTSLQMAGISLTILKLPSDNYQKVLELFDFPINCLQQFSCVRGIGPLTDPNSLKDLDIDLNKQETSTGPEVSEEIRSILIECTKNTCNSLIEEESKLTQYDLVVGDGDCGETHTRAAKAILKLDLTKLSAHPAVLLKEISHTCSSDMGGSSGAIYSILLISLASHMRKGEKYNVELFVTSFQKAVESVKEHTGTKVGYRTMVDVLEPVALYLRDNIRSLNIEELSAFAELSVNKTIAMKAKVGRASYVNQDYLVNPDAGAYAVGCIIKACCKILKTKF